MCVCAFFPFNFAGITPGVIFLTLGLFIPYGAAVVSNGFVNYVACLLACVRARASNQTPFRTYCFSPRLTCTVCASAV